MRTRICHRIQQCTRTRKQGADSDVRPSRDRLGARHTRTPTAVPAHELDGRIRALGSVTICAFRACDLLARTHSFRIRPCQAPARSTQSTRLRLVRPRKTRRGSSWAPPSWAPSLANDASRHLATGASSSRSGSATELLGSSIAQASSGPASP